MKKEKIHFIQFMLILTFGIPHWGCSGEIDNKTNPGTLTELQAAEQELRQEHSIPIDPNERGRAFTAEERRNWPNTCEIIKINSNKSTNPILVVKISNKRNFSLDYHVDFVFYLNGQNHQKDIGGNIQSMSTETIETELPAVPMLRSKYEEGEITASDEVLIDCRFQPGDREMYLQYEESFVNTRGSLRFFDFDRSGLNRIQPIQPMSDASEVVIKITPIESLHARP